MKGVSKMLVKVIDEKQIGKTRLLILDNEPPKHIENNVKIGNKVFKRLDLYDLNKAIAIVCDEDTHSMIGKML